MACFLCQQAAEKALEAVLYAHGAEQVLGHSVADLAEECAAEAFDQSNVRRALTLAGEVIRSVTAKLSG